MAIGTRGTATLTVCPNFARLVFTAYAKGVDGLSSDCEVKKERIRYDMTQRSGTEWGQMGFISSKRGAFMVRERGVDWLIRYRRVRMTWGAGALK